MSEEIGFTLNGRAEVARDVDPHTTLLSYLRQRGLTGAKEGCAEGECGACAVAVVRPGASGRARYEAVNACLWLMPAVAGAELYTVEGISPAGPAVLHPVARALAQHGGSQCGYCTPGFVVSMFCHYYASPRGPVEQALSGNLCRCTGYRPIRDAARTLAEPAREDAFAARLARALPMPAPTTYRAAGVHFERPTRLDDALRLRAADPGAQLVAGGTDVVVELNQTHTRRARFIALDAVAELACFEQTDSELVLGAGLSLLDLQERLAGAVPLIEQLFPLFASLPIRARATLGGNLVTASPVGDGAPVLLALDAEVELASMRGSRRLPLSQFFTGYRSTALAPDELLLAVRLPRRLPTHARFFKVAKRMVDDISTVSAAFALWIEGGVIERARLAFGGVASTPVRALAAEDSLTGQPWDERALTAAQAAARSAFSPIDDFRGSAAYRAAMVERLLQKFFVETCA